MEADQRQYIEGQLELFTGGYDWLAVHFDVHLARSADQIQIGYTITDGPTGAWIAAEVPQRLLRLVDTAAAAQVMEEVVRVARDHLDPF